MMSSFDEFFNLIFDLFLKFGPSVSREHAMGSRNTDAYLMWHVCAKKAYLLLVGLSTKPKLILPYSMYCQSVLHTYMPAKTKSVHTVSL